MLVAGYVGTSPSPPRSPVLVFDDRCGFCRRWIGRLKRMDRDNQLDLLPLGDSRAPVLTGQPEQRLRKAAHLVRPDGAVFAGAAAAREVFRYLRGGWMVRGILSIPGAMPVAERAYAWVARSWGPVSDDRE
jgi:predicted DCC family thiol-disulfide oxidoreductase YuxK